MHLHSIYLFFHLFLLVFYLQYQLIVVKEGFHDYNITKGVFQNMAPFPQF